MKPEEEVLEEIGGMDRNWTVLKAIAFRMKLG
jgi:hypothetical protein